MAERICSIDGCGARHYARGWCRKHYARWDRHGSTDAQVIRDDVEKRFWSKVALPDGDGCWLWQGNLGRLDYGVMPINRKTHQAHRYAYELLIGDIPDGLHLDHLCRVHNCVNPAHLEPVTCRENVLRGEGLAAYNARKTHCHRGHPLPKPDKRGWRMCHECVYPSQRR